MYINLLKKQHYRSMPWKNGKGFTSEIAIYPKEAQFPNDAFLWRISSAHITENGPFSSFAGFNRYLSVIKGEGLHLHFPLIKKDRELKKGDICFFKGDEPVESQLISGPVSDFNVIFHETKVQSNCEKISLLQQEVTKIFQGRYLFLFSVFQSTQVRIENHTTQIIHEGDTLHVELEHTQTPPAILLKAKQKEALLLWIELWN